MFTEIPNKKIQSWLNNKCFPARVLLSGTGNLLEIAISIAQHLQKNSRENIASGLDPDTIIFRDNGKSFKIDWSDTAKKEGQSEYENVRGIIKLAHQKPVAPYRIIILENLERVTREASHALLKIIEEPAEKVIFIFTTKNHHKLLNTIISRVSVVNIGNSLNDIELSEELNNFLDKKKNLSGKFKIIEELDKKSRENLQKKIDRTVFLEFLEDLITVARLLPKYAPNLEILLETHQAISSNLSPKFCFERLALKINSK